MANFTTEVRSICETYAGYLEPQPLNKVDEIIHETHNKVMGNYPIFDEAYREVLDTKILKHYYTREIGAETAALWKLWLNNKMNEIMPYYNKLYESELLEFNPFYDVDITTERDREENANGSTSGKSSEESSMSGESSRKDESEKSGTSEMTGSSEGESVSTSESQSESSGTLNDTKGKQHTDRYSDTPQGGLNGMQSVEQNLYLTNARLIGESENDTQTTEQNTSGTGSTNLEESRSETENVSTSESGSVESTGSETREASRSGTTSGESEMNTVEQYAEHVYGKRGGVSYAKLLMEFRESMINIDLMVIEELDGLFMGLWE